MGRDHWLGKWGSPEAQTAYDRLILEFLATRRVIPQAARAKASAAASSPEVPPSNATPGEAAESPAPETITIAEVVGLSIEHSALGLPKFAQTCRSWPLARDWPAGVGERVAA
jgi:hypothetical protein